MANQQTNTKDPNAVIKINDLFRTFNMYENIEPLSDEIKVFQCEEADETSSINSALSAMSLRSIANSRCNENVSVNDDIQQRLKRIHQMVASRKELKDNEEETIPIRIERNDDDDDDEDEYDEEKGAQLLQKMIASVLKPKSRQKEAFIQNISFRPDIVTSTTDKKFRLPQHEKSDKNGRS
ncbi:unnamed protein product [Rotaria magnacalcarata]|uniref:Uncharacterized protein n=1 Tax=Rotaria magnacalcarata TaxID=392030 RepID=A0A816C346_9BILA|nr:unnamed protein product [Rotaria magnacalcarata]CAF1636678.1 unnamed protein product [Rotaria magnacalcarata]CAF2236659.1 unnamed protein product [Rotaria magnacalcarata]CAF3868950.1 unnamed protein product [Rotaria magnacalcarata]CAF3898449.1 unnamed protein product [Rotaria magnacalcarata]